MKYLLPTIILILIALSTIFLYTSRRSDLDKAKRICVQECQQQLAEGRDLSNGPCLLDPISELPDWVCDVAHSPREDVDNMAENQCSSYRRGIAKHFVEVTPDCKFIRAY